MYKFNTVEEAIEDIREGKMIVVVDNEDRENEGDIVVAAEKVTPEIINFMASHAKGLICTPMSKEMLDKLGIGAMVEKNTDNHETAFTVSVDYKDTETGISAYERALTIKKLVDDSSKADDFRRPGHIFPLVAKENGVLERIGHTEASVDLAVLAGLKPAGTICEIMKDDGHMARVPDLMEFCKEYNLKIITVASLVEYRKRTENLVERVTETKLPTKYGDFMAYGFIDKVTGKEHVALVKGDIKNKQGVLARVHSECLTGDAFGSKRCDCGEQYEAAMKKIEDEGCGILVYMRQEGRGIGLINKLKAYKLQDEGYDTVEANVKLGLPVDARTYDIAASIFKNLEIRNIRLLTNNPDKIEKLEQYGVKVKERVPLKIKANKIDEFYLRTKKEKMAHLL